MIIALWFTQAPTLTVNNSKLTNRDNPKQYPRTQNRNNDLVR